jgi:hypothetical protein
LAIPLGGERRRKSLADKERKGEINKKEERKYNKEENKVKNCADHATPSIRKSWR